MITISVVEIAPSALRSLGEIVGTAEALLWVGGALLLGGAMTVAAVGPLETEDLAGGPSRREGPDCGAGAGTLVRRGNEGGTVMSAGMGGAG